MFCSEALTPDLRQQRVTARSPEGRGAASQTDFSELLRQEHCF